jgi:hypothetical protein
MSDKETNDVFTFKTQKVGVNGALYGWVKLDSAGNVVETSAQTYASEADAEKAIRALASSADIVEVMGVHNINTDANTNVNLVKPQTADENFGMNPVPAGINGDQGPTAPTGNKEEHPNVEKMKVIDAKKED